MSRITAPVGLVMTPMVAGKVGRGFLRDEGQQGARARRLHALDDDLIRGPGRVGGDLAGDDDFQPAFRLGAQALDHALPDDAVDGRLVVLQRQIDMARGVAVHLGDLAAQADVAEAVLQRALEREAQLRDRQGRIVVARGGRRLGGAFESIVVVGDHGVTLARLVAGGNGARAGPLA